MKYEWRKQAKELYLPKNKPEIVTVPSFKFFMIDGKGNPNSEDFSEAIGVLYSLSYALKMLPKKGIIPDGYFDYTVFPLEGIWDLAEEARTLDTLDKSKLIYTIMIRQPDFVTDDLAQEVIEIVKKKKPHPLLDKVKFNTSDDGLCIQMLHLGSYDDEPQTFSIMENYCEQNNLKRSSKIHREIYISDARKTQPDKLKTVLRFKIEHDK
ncbi:GyrI-like domain-containing protein [Tepidibacter hydrothermalis]|uniref:GyrI-like domain-containing protein n=1 Tax=Tepidibacter hydrothermalis TaxID=3036126 RepID=A0ABY8ECM6_9FIRM|nr:GyrI-like domain-containing protein [Tepidibacter hydrothermalis]WFD10673.1 GyrI-like domain-containing protein [Tepidibacter hydrothermalis]